MTSSVKSQNVKKFIAEMSKGEHRVARTTKRSKKLEGLFAGATEIDLAARSTIPRLVLYFFIQKSSVAFEECCKLMVNCKLTNRASIDEWAKFKEDGKRSSQYHWEYQFNMKRSQFTHRLKWSLIHPSHHFTQHALLDAWHGMRGRFNYLPPEYFGTVNARNAESSKGSICGITAVYVIDAFASYFIYLIQTSFSAIRTEPILKDENVSKRFQVTICSDRSCRVP